MKTLLFSLLVLSMAPLAMADDNTNPQPQPQPQGSAGVITCVTDTSRMHGAQYTVTVTEQMSSDTPAVSSQATVHASYQGTHPGFTVTYNDFMVNVSRAKPDVTIYSNADGHFMLEILNQPLGSERSGSLADQSPNSIQGVVYPGKLKMVGIGGHLDGEPVVCQ